LPTEAEWEFACRAGTATSFHYGDTLPEEEFAFAGSTVAVDRFAPNAFGLFGMHTNVAEWCADPWNPRAHSESADGATDPGLAELAHAEGDTSQVVRPIRGGAWGDGAAQCRSAKHGSLEALFRHAGLGFRVLLEIAQ
jgi:formylglycine-generating enzyme required for sulfatase activity